MNRHSGKRKDSADNGAGECFAAIGCAAERIDAAHTSVGKRGAAGNDGRCHAATIATSGFVAADTAWGGGVAAVKCPIAANGNNGLCAGAARFRRGVQSGYCCGAKWSIRGVLEKSR